MLESYIRDYQVNLLDNTFSDDLERLKAIAYGLEHIIDSTEPNIETYSDRYNHNKLITALITLKKIIKEEESKNSISQF